LPYFSRWELFNCSKIDQITKEMVGSDHNFSSLDGVGRVEKRRSTSFSRKVRALTKQRSSGLVCERAGVRGTSRALSTFLLKGRRQFLGHKSREAGVVPLALENLGSNKNQRPVKLLRVDNRRVRRKTPSVLQARG